MQVFQRNLLIAVLIHLNLFTSLFVFLFAKYKSNSKLFTVAAAYHLFMSSGLELQSSILKGKHEPE